MIDDQPKQPLKETTEYETASIQNRHLAIYYNRRPVEVKKFPGGFFHANNFHMFFSTLFFPRQYQFHAAGGVELAHRQPAVGPGVWGQSPQITKYKVIGSNPLAPVW